LKTVLAVTGLILGLLVCVLLLTDREPAHGYAGSHACRACHEDFYQRWESSHHGKAMQPVSPQLLSTLTPPDAPIAISNRTYTVDLKRRSVFEMPPTGRPVRHPMLHALGGKNIYYFLTPLDRGRLQVLPLAYDFNAQTWFDTTASMTRHFAAAPDEALDWRDPLLTFNTACFGCHVSQLEKNYDPKRDTYRTTWREPGISCETCHGPSQAHVQAFRRNKQNRDLHLKSWSGFTPSQVNSACATCHAKAYPLTPAFTPGGDFFDHYGLTCLEDPDFSPDGRDLGENYTYTLWLLNPCTKETPLDCTHCHTSSGRYRFTHNPDASCTTCHAQDIAAHSRHPATKTSELPNCVSCHMPTTSFASMRRSDHSHRPPCPEAAERFGAASACTLCHTGKDEAWAAGHVRKWFPDDTRRAKRLREAGLISAARKREWERAPDIASYLSEANAEPVIAASLLRLLPGCPDPRIWPAARACLTNASPLLRGAAATLLADNLRDPLTAAALCRALADPARLVRIQAAQALATYPRNSLPAETHNLLSAAEAETLAMFNARPDDWASHYNLGNYRLARSDPKGAMAAYRQAMRLRSDAVMPHVNAAVLASQEGRLQEAIGYLRTALAAAPKHGAVNLNLGLALAEAGDPRQAERHLRTAMDDPACRAQAAYNLAVLTGPRDPAAAAGLIREAITCEPDNPRYRDALEYFLKQ